MKNNEEVHIVKEENFNDFSAGFLREKFRQLSLQENKASIALSGGTTPLPILNILKNHMLNWERLQFFMVDERVVPIANESSNYGNIKRIFFDFVSSSSYSMFDENSTLDECVISYEKILKRDIKRNQNGFPVISLVLLGMGEDGHIASLFPNTEGLLEQEKCVIVNRIPQLNTQRISMTYPMITSAEEVIVFIKGEKKIKIFEELKQGKGHQYPIHKLLKSGINITWVIGEN